MKDLYGFLTLSIFEGIGLMFAAMLLSWSLKLSDLYIILSALSFFTPFVLNYLFHDIVFEKRKLQKESLLPDLLLEASVFCDETSFINTIRRLSMQEFPLLSKDFQRAFNEISSGAGVEETLERMRKMNQSRAFSSVLSLLLQGYHSGAGMSDMFKEAAENLLEMQAVLRERGAVMLINKYTLILAAGLIVPAILGLIVGLVSGMSFDSIGEMSIGMEVGERVRMLELASLGTNIYLGEYAIISAFFLAIQEGNKKNFWIYGAVLLPLSLGIFHLAQIL